jgi:hypothetical protein
MPKYSSSNFTEKQKEYNSLLQRMVKLNIDGELHLSRKTEGNIHTDLGDPVLRVSSSSSEEQDDISPHKKAQDMLDAVFLKLSPFVPETHIRIINNATGENVKSLKFYVQKLQETEKKTLWYSFQVGDLLTLLRESSSTFLPKGTPFVAWVKQEIGLGKTTAHELMKFYDDFRHFPRFLMASGISRKQLMLILKECLEYLNLPKDDEAPEHHSGEFWLINLNTIKNHHEGGRNTPVKFFESDEELLGLV